MRRHVHLKQRQIQPWNINKTKEQSDVYWKEKEALSGIIPNKREGLQIELDLNIRRRVLQPMLPFN
ncbi:hypothetical protein QWZ08_16505 [Ferruginibacter paludis]|uniref:hypothetical protein n=1 Tax=Ferruginibacter paludis TaxID=1310417 RepID=UPI0025B3F3C5|nr:hypothetical protein [Ferruginibacter paludis]MDN3657253.1 hypothetical protein [Ferruginibacter paludis]